MLAPKAPKAPLRSTPTLAAHALRAWISLHDRAPRICSRQCWGFVPSQHPPVVGELACQQTDFRVKKCGLLMP